MELKHPYPGVVTPGGISFGGDQRRSADPVMRRCGCGIVAVADLLLYFSRYHPNCGIPPLTALGDEALTQERYDALTQWLRWRYFPLLYPTGIPGFLLAAGLNRLFRRWHLPYAARWGVPTALLWETVEELLRQDIPVILAVGGNFPCVWRKDRLPMRREGGGAASVRAHYVVVTAMDGDTLTVSSWGRKYTVSRRAYSRYVRQSSSTLVSNLLYLRKTR